ncbi:unnamed protein product [Caenorhabditis auriculariae]|uniref:Uncharacterized protein n=1 Tax=Caenorhabditis auriculariae TaxID=2777116 RepID=A0A8S1GNK1_9PELO|nr:unnamed protein product [Caenorhabditis auriculariae]
MTSYTILIVLTTIKTSVRSEMKTDEMDRLLASHAPPPREDRMRVELPLFLFLTCVVSTCQQTQNVTCSCAETRNLADVQTSVKLAVKVNVLRALDKVRSTMAHAMSEKEEILKWTRYAAIYELKQEHGSRIEMVNFIPELDKFLTSVSALFREEQRLTDVEIFVRVMTALNHFMKETLPESFQCIAMSHCLSLDPVYQSCMLNVTENWEKYLGQEPRRSATIIAEAIFKHRVMEATLSHLHAQLLQMNQTVTKECVENYAKITSCLCTTPEVSFCKQSCTSTLEKCLASESSEWIEQITGLQRVVNSYPKGGILFAFISLKKGISDSFQMLTERKLPLLAEAVFGTCGTAVFGGIMARKPVINRKPTRYAAKTNHNILELQQLRRIWDIIPEKMCARASTAPCWNGSEMLFADSELPPITKDVRPRPKQPAWIIESSSDSSWNPDEENYGDDEEFSGSGLPPHIDEEPIGFVSRVVKRPEISNEILDDNEQPQRIIDEYDGYKSYDEMMYHRRLLITFIPIVMLVLV